MALNQNEKELLAVVRYFNKEVENKHVARLVAKLTKDFEIDDVRALTGFSENEINVLLNSVAPRSKRLGPSKATKKVQADIRAEMKALDEAAERSVVFDETKLSGRVAKEIYTAVRSNPDEKEIPSVKQIMTTLEVTNATARGAIAILRKMGLIEYADPDNPKKGFVLK